MVDRNQDPLMEEPAVIRIIQGTYAILLGYIYMYILLLFSQPG